MKRTQKICTTVAMVALAVGASALPAVADSHAPAPPWDGHTPVAPLGDSHAPTTPLGDGHTPVPPQR
ncbi:MULTISPECIES: hypothetical protein [unclassified Streptomyces]|uniref:hypothetical protein n=1 Tax=unclassified Streptomyces TaxID=2593676 RepID=UPI0007483892|nr:MULTISPECIES: hypothetical protein [unclassified Streptomyces]KUL47844.1 hypothetical protein ADL30_36055 [Streptomyces sp. NRRL S-1521]THC47783.1 hypothetical protein E7X58_26285 [Streptomyces sp. A1499]